MTNQRVAAILGVAAAIAAAAAGQTMPAIPPPAPQVSALTPSSGPAAGGTRVSVVGYSLLPHTERG